MLHVFKTWHEEADLGFKIILLKDLFKAQAHGLERRYEGSSDRAVISFTYIFLVQALRSCNRESVKVNFEPSTPC